MLTFLEKLLGVLSFIGHYLWIALKAIGRFLLWLGSTILRLLSDLITWCRLNLSARVQMILLAVIVALIIVGVALLFTGHGCSASSSNDPATDEAPPQVSYTLNEKDLQQLSYDPETITSFSLVQSGAQMYADLSEENNQAITEALAPFQKDGGDVGFLIMNLNSGSGFCYDIDTEIYGASTYKAPLSVYLCEEYIDGGTLKKSAVSTRIENSIIWSDNKSYRSLKHSFEGSEHNAWLSSLGLDPKDFTGTFPSYSVRDSATLWMHTWDYLNSGSDTAEWLGGLLSQTETSFLRNGTEQAGMTDATVYNKAGWCVSKSGSEDAVNDAGIVVDGDNVYLVVAFTSAADNPTAEANLANLFKALLDARHSLDASNATWENVEMVEAPAEEEGSSEAVTGSSDGQKRYEIVTAPSDPSDSSNGQGAAQSSQSTQLVIDANDGERLLVTEAFQ